MAMGAELLLKSMGFDPAEVTGKFQEAKENLAKAMKHFEQRLDTMDKKLDRLIAELEQEQEQSKEVAINGR